MPQEQIRCIAFDCFGTIFDMSSVSERSIKDYVDHVRKNDFSPFFFGADWWAVKPHEDCADGIERLQAAGFKCVALSNGDKELIRYVADIARFGFKFDYVIDLAGRHKVYKPHLDAYRSIEKDLGYKPENTLMVTANPAFGDVDGAEAIGMRSQVIRHGYPDDLNELADLLIGT